MKSTEIVQQFLNSWGTPGGWRQAFRASFTDDRAYELVGSSKTVGQNKQSHAVPLTTPTTPSRI
jgi:limonene-1,2-epoxide hydrolase